MLERGVYGRDRLRFAGNLYEFALMISGDMHEHLAQSIAYARMKRRSAVEQVSHGQRIPGFAAHLSGEVRVDGICARSRVRPA